MIEATARDLLTFLVTTFINNGLSDIGTYLLPSESQESQFQQEFDSYPFIDSTAALMELLRESDSRSKDALRRLLAAAQQYFSEASAIPSRYAAVIATFDSSNQRPINKTIQLLGRDGERATNVSSLLESSQVRQMQRWLSLLGEHLNDEDDFFLSDLDNL